MSSLFSGKSDQVGQNHLKNIFKKILPRLAGKDGVIFGTTYRILCWESGHIYPIPVSLLANYMTLGKSLHNSGPQSFHS